jgi:hypothetical protein
LTDWADVGRELDATISASLPGGDVDAVRQRYLNDLREATGRPAIVYATDFTNQLKSNLASQMGTSTSIDLTDKDGFHQVIQGLSVDALDVVLHSPGGSAEAAESIVALLRPRFSNIRFIVPSVAKSAATMLALSGNRIAMDEMSELGPIDPQMVVNRNGQTIVAPLHSIRDQFLRAQQEIAEDPSKLPAWVPIIQQYGPSLLVECDNRIRLAQALAKSWLQEYMFAGEHDAEAKAEAISAALADDKNFLSHSRRVGMDHPVLRDVKIENMRKNESLQSAVHGLYFALRLTFQRTGALKIFESSEGQRLITILQVTPQEQQPQPQPPPGQATSGQHVSRQVRRQQARGREH